MCELGEKKWFGKKTVVKINGFSEVNKNNNKKEPERLGRLCQNVSSMALDSSGGLGENISRMEPASVER